MLWDNTLDQTDPQQTPLELPGRLSHHTMLFFNVSFMISSFKKKKKVTSKSLPQTTGWGVVQELPQAKSTTGTRTYARLKWLFSYCLLSASVKTGAAWRIRSTWGKNLQFPQIRSNSHWSHKWWMDTGDTHQSRLCADVPSRLDTESWKCCWNCLTSFPARHRAGRRRTAEALSVWLSPCLTEPREKLECWHSIQSAVHSSALALW